MVLAASAEGQVVVVAEAEQVAIVEQVSLRIVGELAISVCNEGKQLSFLQRSVVLEDVFRNYN